ncbi:MAG TPA: HEAT repeat domain-containing protein [Planctomycetota bacterium]
MTASIFNMDIRSALRRLTASAPDTDAEALRLLSEAPDDEARRALADVFADGESALPGGLARVLTGRADARAIQLLLPLLRNENPRVRNAARGVLERVGGETPGPVYEFSRDPDPRMRIFATSILGCFTSAPAAVDRLVEMLADADPTVVDCAIAALGALRAEAAVPQLAEYLARNRSWIRLSALDALMRVGTPAAVRAILAALPGADAETAAILVSVLGRLESDAPPDLAAEIRAALARSPAR